MLCDGVTRGYGDHFPLTTEYDILYWGFSNLVRGLAIPLVAQCPTQLFQLCGTEEAPCSLGGAERHDTV